MNWWCVLLGHAWRVQYRNMYSQHPVHITRDHPTKTVMICGEEFPELEFLQKCDRCEEERWI